MIAFILYNINFKNVLKIWRQISDFIDFKLMDLLASPIEQQRIIFKPNFFISCLNNYKRRQMLNKANSNRSNRKTVRRVQTQAEQPLPIRKSQHHQKVTELSQPKIRKLMPFTKLQPKEPNNTNKKTFKVFNLKPSQNRILKTQPNEHLARKNSQTADKTKSQKTKYLIEGIAGKGTFGMVYYGYNRVTGEKIAIKKVFQDKKYKNRELSTLKMIKSPFLLEMKDYFHSFEGDQEFLNVVMDFFPFNLYQVIQKKQLSTSLIRIYLYQILRGLNYLSTLSIAHRDMKPQNVLINFSTNQVVICDFGSAKKLVDGEPNLAYICSRSYRAPELMFGATNYSPKIDMWSLGCITVEMINKEPPFFGESQIQQLIETIRILGTPSMDEIADMNENYDMNEFSKIPLIKGVEWKSLLKTQNANLIDLVHKMLTYSPNNRLSPAQAIMHPFFDELRNQELFRHLQVKYKEIPQLFDFSEEQLKQFPTGSDPVPQWTKQRRPQIVGHHHLNGISVKKPLHKFV